MASLIRIDLAASADMMTKARVYAGDNNMTPAEIALALVVAGFGILSAGMDEEQFRAVVEQAAEITAPLRKESEKRHIANGLKTVYE